MRRDAYVGTVTLLRLALRRDRILLPSWILVLVVVAVSSASATAALYPTVASREAIARLSNATASLVAMYGPVYAPGSLGAVSVLKLTVFGAFGVALLMIFLVVRHTRAEEQSGRLELLRAGVLGRHASLAAALLLTAGASVLLGGLTALGMIAVGLDPGGSAAFGTVWALSGIVFAAVAAVTAQLVQGARTARGIAIVALAVSYLLRAGGDLTAVPVTGEPGALSWISPLGWVQQVRPYAGDRWPLVLLPVALTAVAVTVALMLETRRDIAAGLLPTRLGRARAPGSLSSPLGLAWRLQRAALGWWLVGFLALGAVVGSVAFNVEGMLDSPESRRLIEQLGGTQDITDAFLAAELGVLAVAASGFGISSALRLRSEETAQRAEMLLATGASRVRWMASHVVIAVVGSALLMAAAGIGAGLSAGHTAADGSGQLGVVVGAALARVPAVWVLTAAAVALFGLRPRWVVAAWVLLAGCLLAGEFGALLGLPTWMQQLSPYTHVSDLPAGQISAVATGLLVVVAAGLLLVGFAGFRERDLASA